MKKVDLSKERGKLKHFTDAELLEELDRRKKNMLKKVEGKFHLNTLFTHRWQVHSYNSIDGLTCAKKTVVSHLKYTPFVMEEKRPVDGWFVVRLRTEKDKRKWAIFDAERKSVKNKRGNTMYFKSPALAILHAENVAARRLTAYLRRVPRNIGEMLSMLRGE